MIVFERTDRVPSPITSGDISVQPHDDRRFTISHVVDPSDPYLEGHFPELTIFPGVFQIELVRLGVPAFLQRPPDQVHITGVRAARFLAPALAGDVINIDCTATPAGAGIVDVDCTCCGRDGEQLATLSIQFEVSGV